MSDSAILTAALAILALPLLSYVLTFFFGNKLPRRGDFIGVTLLGICEVLAIAIFVQFWRLADPTYRVEANFRWIDLGGFHLDAGILVDGMTAVMLMVVCTISFLVHVYSMGYMHGDRRYDRFFAFLGFFSFSMLGIVLSNNLFFLYVFWELVGLSSYLLIGFFFHKHSAANANKKAFLANRVGDYGFWLGILIFFTATGTMNYFELFANVHAGTLTGALLTWAGIGLFMGCVGKSAQMPLHIWLPDAMEGPTPVSALIHAATMVAAGVYMVARLHPLFSPDALLVVLYVGAITAFLAATIAFVKTDIKRVLAFSTLSQLGYMVMALGALDAANAMFHLTTHAMFKALLFLGAGSVIHAVHTQEMPEMGGLRKKMPVTFATFLIATLAIAGVPGLAGFYSKDGILGSTLAFAMERQAHYIPFILGITAAGMTAFYMFRAVFMTFFGKPRDQHRFDHAHESPWSMAGPLVVLAVLSIVAAGWSTASEGWFARYTVAYDVPGIAAEFGMASSAHAGELAPTDAHGGDAALAHDTAGDVAPAHDTADDVAFAHDTAGDAAPAHDTAHAGSGHDDHGGHIAHEAHQTAMTLSIIMAGLGILGAWLVYHRRLLDTAALQRRLHPVYTVLQGQYFFDEFYAATVYRATLWVAWLTAAFDRVVIDGIVNGSGYLTRVVSWFVGQSDRWVVDGMVNGVGAVMQGAGEGLRRFQTGRLQTYLVYVSASVVVLVLIYRAL
ncbi:MAG: NADH-quinone oxidoreductase subunit L [Candidatus Krumholzibacteriia bacterium]